MPELPEVETVRRGLAPHLAGRRIETLTVRNPSLRWPIPAGLSARLAGQRVSEVRRRAKYLIVDCDAGHLVIHLGMSGSLRLLPGPQAPQRHDHFDILLDSGKLVRFTEPRRFGSLHWFDRDAPEPALLAGLGVEPLLPQFDGPWLYRATRGRRTAIKLFLMDGRQVAGVGNIYANEALFRAGINPRAAAGRIGPDRAARLVAAVKSTLEAALEAGGSTLRDFVDSAGDPGQFQLAYDVYGRDGAPCHRCGGTVRLLRQGQRSTFYCPGCQK